MKKPHPQVEPFVKVPLWWIEAAAKATKSPRTLVLMELLHTAWKIKRSTFPLGNMKLARRGVSREVKRKVLRDLERAGLVRVDRRDRKTVVVTLCAV
jgi:hypothetical protein